MGGLASWTFAQDILRVPGSGMALDGSVRLSDNLSVAIDVY